MGARRARAAALTLAALLLAGCGLQQDVANRIDQGSGVGVRAPVLQGSMLDGSGFAASSLRGRVAVVDFWASWCGPCRAQQPALDQLARDYAGRGVVFVGVDMRDDPAEGRAYLARFSVPYASLSDSSGSLANQWNVPAPPTTVVVDPSGVVRARVLGGIDRTGAGALLDKLLEGQT